MWFETVDPVVSQRDLASRGQILQELERRFFADQKVICFENSQRGERVETVWIDQLDWVFADVELFKFRKVFEETFRLRRFFAVKFGKEVVGDVNNSKPPHWHIVYRFEKSLFGYFFAGEVDSGIRKHPKHPHIHYLPTRTSKKRRSNFRREPIDVAKSWIIFY